MITVFVLFISYILSVRALEVPEKDLAEDLFSRSFQSVQNCHAATSSCTQCYQVCSRQRSYFGNSYMLLDTPSKLYECRVNMSHHRVGVASWCHNDEHEFYATNDFKASPKSCQMDQAVCAKKIKQFYNAKVRSGEMSGKHEEYQLAKKLQVAGILYKQLKEKEDWYQETKTKYKRLKQWYEDNVLEEMNEHLKDPTESKTRFADPVYKESIEMNQKVKKNTQYIARINVEKSRKETESIRRASATEIDRHLRSIKRLENHIQSSKKSTNKYLFWIKKLVYYVYTAQQKAMDLAYETSHESNLDDELITLNGEVSGKMDGLGKEKIILSKEMNLAAKEKVKLVEKIRDMIESITLEQKRNKCRVADLFKF